MRKHLTINEANAQEALEFIAWLCETSLDNYETLKESESSHYWNGYLSQALKSVMQRIKSAERGTEMDRLIGRV